MSVVAEATSIVGGVVLFLGTLVSIATADDTTDWQQLPDRDCVMRVDHHRSLWGLGADFDERTEYCKS